MWCGALAIFVAGIIPIGWCFWTYRSKLDLKNWGDLPIGESCLVVIIPKDPLVCPKNPGLTLQSYDRLGWDWDHQILRIFGRGLDS